MRKLRIALCLALVAGTLTLTNGLLHDARMATIIYRVVISIVLFGVIGYVLAVVGERFYESVMEKNIAQGQPTDIVSEQPTDDDKNSGSESESESESEFSPFASDNFEQISRPKE